MTTATGGAKEDDEVLTTELEPERPAERERLAPATAKALFLSLAGVAALALIAALVAVAMSERLSVPAFRGWLFTSLGVVALIVVLEIVLLLVMARPRKA